MLAIASAASASKETLYSWFEDKQGLFTALIQRNAAQVQAALRSSLEHDLPPEEALRRFGLELLALLLGDAAVRLNRAAICEANTDSKLGAMIVRHGRDAAIPVLVAYLEAQKVRCRLEFSNADEAAGTLIGLLVGENQTLRLLGVMPRPDREWIDRRAAGAVRDFMHLFGVSGHFHRD